MARFFRLSEEHSGFLLRKRNTKTMTTEQYHGILVIGDPHLEGRQPGFRKDHYPQVILDKLHWCMEYAEANELLPVILGDLFDKPRDNPNWMLDELLRMWKGSVLTIFGNHDVHFQPELTGHDTLSLLVSAGKLQLVSGDNPWFGYVCGKPVVIGGASYRQKLPVSFEFQHYSFQEKPFFVIWLTHHDLMIPGYDEGREKPREIPGIDLVINGHIHRRLDDVSKGRTLWKTPGNIARRSRNDATRDHIPRVLLIELTDAGAQYRDVVIPHEPFGDVFHDAVIENSEKEGASKFISGLAELQARRTATGEGLKAFLEQNLEQFPPKVAAEIRQLAKDILTSDSEASTTA